MRYQHFEQLQPLCPVCLGRQDEHPLQLHRINCESNSKIWEGALICSDASCQSEYPIIDGVPILMPNLRDYIANNIYQLISRDDLSESSLSLLGDCCSQNSHFDITRQHLSCYAWDHYAQNDPGEPSKLGCEASSQSVDSPPLVPGSIVRALHRGLSAWTDGSLPEGPLLDAGCSVGRTAFELAQRTPRLVLGIDTNFSMLRLASKILRDSRVTYAKRRIGLVYEQREFEVRFERSDCIDFWACDAMAMPFRKSTFAGGVAMNLLDSVPSPAGLISRLHEHMQTGGKLLLASPYDWATAVTPVESWLGGHSQRSPSGGDCAAVLRHLLTTGDFEIEHEWPDVPWQVRMHDRSSMAYRLHMLQCRRLER